jgi:MFS family permease
MSGLAFALFYTVLGIPIARYADGPRSNRVGIIAAALAVWSAFTALCGLAGNFWQLLLARIGVGVGEAGCTPPAHSLIADYVPPERRASAIAFYGLGIPIGGLLGGVIGGVLADTVGWRAAFFVVGIPGVALALLVWMTLKEPRRSRPAPLTAAGARPFWSSVREILGARSFLWLCAAASVAAWVGYGLAAWVPQFFIRNFGLTNTEVGVWQGLSGGLSAALGTWLGGRLSDRYGKIDARHMLTAPAIGMAVGSIGVALALLLDNWVWVLVAIFIPGLLNSMWYGPVFACVQGVVAPHNRALAAAVILFVLNLIGLGFGPTLVGWASDVFAAQRFAAEGAGAFGTLCVKGGPADVAALCQASSAAGLERAIVLASLLGVFAAVFMWLARRHLAADMARAKAVQA